MSEGELIRTSDIVSFGSRGWVAVLTAHVPQDDGVWPHIKKLKKIGIALLPATGAKGMIAAGQTGGANTAVVFLESLRPAGKGVGWAKLVHIGDGPEDDRFLLGYAVFEAAKPPHHYDFPEQYMLVEVTHNGTLLTEPVRVDNAGWTLQSTWSVMDGKRGRCAVWPNAWADAIDPLGRGPSNWYGQYGAYDYRLREAGVQNTMFSSTLRIMTYCPDDVTEDRLSSSATSPAGTTRDSTAPAREDRRLAQQVHLRKAATLDHEPTATNDNTITDDAAIHTITTNSDIRNENAAIVTRLCWSAFAVLVLACL